MRTLELIPVAWLLLVLGAVATKGRAEKLDCRERCGNLTMEYPFGITEPCYLHESGGGFQVRCENNVPTLAAAAPNDNHTFTILQFRPPNQVVLQTSEIMAVDCNESTTVSPSEPNTYNFSVKLQLPEPFMVSALANLFRALGCYATANINNTDIDDTEASAMNRCDTLWMQSGGGWRTKHGEWGQCQIALPEGSASYTYSVTSPFNYDISAWSRNCSYALLAQKEYEIVAEVLDNYADVKKQAVNGSIGFPLVAEWVIKDKKCNNGASPTCGVHAWCNYTSSGSGYNCHCEEGRKGNPYLKGSAGCRTHEGSKRSKRWTLWIIIMMAVGFMILLLYCFKRHLQRTAVQREEDDTRRELSILVASTIENGGGKFGNIGNTSTELPTFGFGDVLAATNNFSLANKLGEGGFGPVYKGTLLNEQDVAVKRLSRTSGQGLQEFKNEVLLISRLQHKNLVRLIGMCVHGEEKLLIYEYLPNKSLDFFLFDPTKQEILDWEKRSCIIDGIAQGLLYLHKYSRLTVIHRDLKASNILLDGNMNPKISDFGMARMFSGNELEANTNRVVGTYGYMSPEYAMEGLFSVKSDVFSFGVLLLEILTSKKNTSFHLLDQSLNLLGYAWELWSEGRALQLIDPVLVGSSPAAELTRYIHVALLCVQERAKDRPAMSEVISFLNNPNAVMLSPRQPAFFVGRNAQTGSLSGNRPIPCSVNDVTISETEGR